MSQGAPEPRTPVMIMVEASWDDQNGLRQRSRARMENKSPGGACVRLSKSVRAGTRLRIEGKWEQFWGEVRYCRKDGRDYLIGVQKDKSSRPTAPAVEPAIAAPLQKHDVPAHKENPDVLLGAPASPKAPAETPLSVAAFAHPPLPVEELLTQTTKEARGTDRQQRFKEVFAKETNTKPSASFEDSKERKHMRRKWFDLGHKSEQQDLNGQGETNSLGSSRPPVQPIGESIGITADEETTPDSQVELLSMDDIYRLAGIMAPRKGYSINKIVEMLGSEHLRGLSREMKRASVLMALDAAGVSVDEVLQDAKARQDAIDSYEADQRKQFEALLARKAEENVQIQAELERMKARFNERLRRNLDGMAREKVTFGNWLTMKQQESQSMTEAIDLCLKPSAQESSREPIDEVSLAGARVKPV